MNLDEFIRATYKEIDFYVRPRIFCNDGFNFSVQGGVGSYSSPRKNSKDFTRMEIGFPSEVEELIMQFSEDKEMPTETVYGWVDCDIIQNVIDKHGGIDEVETFKNKISN